MYWDIDLSKSADPDQTAPTLGDPNFCLQKSSNCWHQCQNYIGILINGSFDLSFSCDGRGAVRHTFLYADRICQDFHGIHI